MANGNDIQFDTNLLANRIADIRAALVDKTMSMEDKMNLVLRNQEINLMVILSDHAKVGTMWGTFKPMAWAMTTADAINVSTGVRDNGSFAAALTAGTDAFDQLRVGFLEAMWTFGAASSVTFRFAQNTAGVGHHARTRTGSILRYRQIV